MALIKKSQAKGKMNIAGKGPGDGDGKEEGIKGEKVEFKTKSGIMGVTVQQGDKEAVRMDQKWTDAFGDKAAAMHAFGFRRYDIQAGGKTVTVFAPKNSRVSDETTDGKVIGYRIPYGSKKGERVLLSKKESGIGYDYFGGEKNLEEPANMPSDEMFNDYTERTMYETKANVDRLRSGGRYLTKGSGGKTIGIEGELPKRTREEMANRVESKTGMRGLNPESMGVAGPAEKTSAKNNAQYEAVTSKSGQVTAKKKTPALKKK
jgi:hypothetical protein